VVKQAHQGDIYTVIITNLMIWVEGRFGRVPLTNPTSMADAPLAGEALSSPLRFNAILVSIILIAVTPFQCQSLH
jgi:hypothetical protein